MVPRMIYCLLLREMVVCQTQPESSNLIHLPGSALFHLPSSLAASSATFAASTQLPFHPLLPDIFIFWSLLLETHLHQRHKTDLNEDQSHFIAPLAWQLALARYQRSQELTSMRNLLQVVDQDPGLWFGKWSWC